MKVLMYFECCVLEGVLSPKRRVSLLGLGVAVAARCHGRRGCPCRRRVGDTGLFARRIFFCSFAVVSASPGVSSILSFVISQRFLFLYCLRCKFVGYGFLLILFFLKKLKKKKNYCDINRIIYSIKQFTIFNNSINYIILQLN